MTATLLEFLARLRRIGEGGKQVSSGKGNGEHKFWDGYLQAVEDMADFVRRSGAGRLPAARRPDDGDVAAGTTAR
jgi:hypothetical protein